MNIVRRLLIASIAAAALVSTAAFAADANVAGKWTMDVNTQAGTGTPTFELKQQGSDVTGTYKGTLGEVPVTGKVTGNEITLTFKGNAQGQDINVTYTGKVEGTSIAGKVSLGEFGDGTFTGKKT
jgi:hypothetical protein